MNNNLITVTAQIGKCIYHIEMDQKSSYAEMLTEVENALEIKNKPIKILKYVHQTNQSTN